MTQSNIGSFVWYDMLANDPSAAIAFYTDVAGWKAEAWENGYTMFVGSQGPVGDAVALPEEAKKFGQGPHWMANVSVADVEATVAKARKLGGAVRVEPMDIPKIGRYAIIADPQGVGLSVIQMAQPMPPPDTTKAGAFTWNELLTSDYEAAFRFYNELFGWKKVRELDMGPMGKYLIYGLDDREFGGMFNVPNAGMPPSFCYYIHVDDLDAALARAVSKGATVMNGPMEVPGGARIVQLLDPQKAMFALHEAKRAT